MSRPKLQGLAKQMMMRHVYQANVWNRANGFYRFLLLNSSTISTGHHFLSRMRLTISFMEHIICPKDCRFLQIRSDFVVFTSLQLTKPTEIRLVFTKEYNSLEKEWIKKEMWHLMPVLGGVNKLEMPVDSTLLFVLQLLSEQLNELWCADKLLISNDCPVLNLKRLKMGVDHNRMSYRVRPVLLVHFHCLFRHKIQHLDLTNFNFDSFCDNLTDLENSGQRAVESLKIQLNNHRGLLDKVLPFILSFREQMPNFNELEMGASNFHFNIEESDLSATLMAFYHEILEIKERTKHFLRKLIIRFDGFEFALKKRIEQNWHLKLKEGGKFSSFKFTENQIDNIQIVKLQKFDAPLNLDIRFELNISNQLQWNPLERDDDAA